MTISAKICGINDRAAMMASVDGGARFVGLNFYPPSPRAVTPTIGGSLTAIVPDHVTTVGLFVDPDDATVREVVEAARIDMLQLHGNETPERVAAFRDRFGKPVMKAIKVADPSDLGRADAYVTSADWLLFDAKAPPQMAAALPGGNAVSFDWQLLAGQKWPVPWMLAGGLTADNVTEAVRTSGAAFVDVSSGVEDAPGRKSPEKIVTFLAVVKQSAHQ